MRRRATVDSDRASREQEENPLYQSDACVDLGDSNLRAGMRISARSHGHGQG